MSMPSAGHGNATCLSLDSTPGRRMPSKKIPSPGARTDSGPARSQVVDPTDPASVKQAETQALVAAMPFNSAKPHEHGFENGANPVEGDTAEAASRLPSSSTISEVNGTDKTGSLAIEGVNATIDTLDRVRVDSIGRPLT